MALISSTVVDSWLPNQKEINKLSNKKRKNVTESCISLISHFLFAFEQGVGWEISQCRLKCLGIVIRFCINTISLGSRFRETWNDHLISVRCKCSIYLFTYCFERWFWLPIYHPLSKNFKTSVEIRTNKIRSIPLVMPPLALTMIVLMF